MYECLTRLDLYNLKQTLALALLGPLCWVQRASSLVHTDFDLRPFFVSDR